MIFKKRKVQKTRKVPKVREAPEVGGVFLWHISGMDWSPRRCKHRVITEAGPYFIVQATCKRIPDPLSDWKNEDFKVKQVPRSWVIPGEIPKSCVSSNQWYSTCPPVPEKREPRPYVPPPSPWETCSQEEFRKTWEPKIKDVLRDEGTQTKEAAKVLGVSWPCSEKDARAAYRKRAREAHPDTGGSSEEFIRVKTSFDRLVRVIKATKATTHEKAGM